MGQWWLVRAWPSTRACDVLAHSLERVHQTGVEEPTELRSHSGTLAPECTEIALSLGFSRTFFQGPKRGFDSTRLGVR